MGGHSDSIYFGFDTSDSDPNGHYLRPCEMLRVCIVGKLVIWELGHYKTSVVYCFLMVVSGKLTVVDCILIVVDDLRGLGND